MNRDLGDILAERGMQISLLEERLAVLEATNSQLRHRLKLRELVKGNLGLSPLPGEMLLALLRHSPNPLTASHIRDIVYTSYIGPLPSSFNIRTHICLIRKVLSPMGIEISSSNLKSAPGYWLDEPAKKVLLSKIKELKSYA